MPERIAINETASFLLCRDNVGAGNFVVVREKLFERVIEPAAFRVPTSDRRCNTLLQNILRDDGVVGQLHLIDRDGVWLEFDCATYGFTPLLFRLTHHPCDEIDIDLREVNFTCPLVSTVNLG